MKGVGVLYHAFRKSLRENRAKIAPLQVVSRLEEYLTKEFCSVIFTKSGMNILPLTSPGLSKDKRRIDLALLEGDLSKARDLATARIRVSRDTWLMKSFHGAIYNAPVLTGVLRFIRPRVLLDHFETHY